MRVFLIFLAAVFFGFVPSAQAGRLTASVAEADDPRTCGESCSSAVEFFASYTAIPGEGNRVTVTREGPVLHVRDEGAPITVDSSICRLTAPGAADCDVPAGTTQARADIGLGDGDDSATVNGLPSTVQGGAGNDTLTGGDATDQIEAGDGDDVLHGGGGADALDGGLGADAIDGGDGIDMVFYSRATPVTVDLGDPTPDGGPGEGDRITTIENVSGGSGDDVLAGGDEDNFLFGGSGRDRLLGRGGNDRLEGGDGVDTYDAGDGDDNLTTHDGGRGPGDKLACGSGDDAVFEPDIADVIPVDCEQVAPENVDAERAQPIGFRGGAIVLALAQREGLGNKRATVTVRTGDGRTVLARGTFRTRRGADTTRVRAALTRAGRKFAARRSGKAIRIEYVVRVRNGVIRTGYSVRLR